MKYYGELTKTLYESEQDCLKAEANAKAQIEAEKAKKEQEMALAKQQKEQALAERKALAGQVDEARKAMVAAQKAYQGKLKEFIDKYHSYHFTSTDPSDIPTLFDLFDKIFPF